MICWEAYSLKIEWFWDSSEAVLEIVLRWNNGLLLHVRWVVKDLDGTKIILLNQLPRAPIERLRQRTGKLWTVLNSNQVVPTYRIKEYRFIPPFPKSMYHVIYLSAYLLFYPYISPSIHPSSVQPLVVLSIYLYIQTIIFHSYIHMPTYPFKSDFVQ